MDLISLSLFNSVFCGLSILSWGMFFVDCGDPVFVCACVSKSMCVCVLASSGGVSGLWHERDEVWHDD